eukprot:scaffold137605_cov17-Tisochrysis_lutea.AAC.1
MPHLPCQCVAYSTSVQPASPFPSTLQLVIAFHMNAAAMGEFTKAEFSEGMLKMGVDSVDKLKKKLPELREELNNPDRFHDIYNYAYMFSREASCLQPPACRDGTCMQCLWICRFVRICARITVQDCQTRLEGSICVASRPNPPTSHQCSFGFSGPCMVLELLSYRLATWSRVTPHPVAHPHALTSSHLLSIVSGLGAKGQKCVHLETAVGMWQLLFSGNRWPLVNEWCDFLQKHHNRAISKDTWTQ